MLVDAAPHSTQTGTVTVVFSQIWDIHTWPQVLPIQLDLCLLPFDIVSACLCKAKHLVPALQSADNGWNVWYGFYIICFREDSHCKPSAWLQLL